jgi:predicted nucleic acid-binding protein
MSPTSLVDTNILVYRHDPRDPRKQSLAKAVLRKGIGGRSVAVAYQCVVEFVAAVSRPQKALGGKPLLALADALLEAEGLMAQFTVLYPTTEQLVTGIRGTALYGLPWFDAQMWACAEVNGLSEILSEDFQHGRHYGTVRAMNPFVTPDSAVHELPALYET